MSFSTITLPPRPPTPLRKVFAGLDYNRTAILNLGVYVPQWVRNLLTGGTQNFKFYYVFIYLGVRKHQKVKNRYF